MAAKTKIILVTIIFLVLGGTSFWVLNKSYGWIKIGADTITGCQDASLITSFMGKPGGNLVTYGLFGHDVSVNEKITSSLDMVQRDVNAAGTGYTFDDIQTFNYRRKTGGGGLSLHSWGIAVDINPSRNPYQARNNGELQTDIPPQIIEIFKKYGFQWGGDWVGNRDPMHFEWYGSGVSGSTVDSVSGQKVINSTSIVVDNTAMSWANGDFSWVLPATHSHIMSVVTKGYENAKFDFTSVCFQNQAMNISLNPLSDNLSGTISGRVTVAGKAPLMPVEIYLDGKLVTDSDVNGDYTIPNVRRGKHKIGAKILFSTGVEINAPDILPQENVSGVNIEMGGK